MTQARIVLSTAGSLDEAERLAYVLVENRLAACVNLVPNLTSIYSWQGRIERGAEILLLIKTTEDRLTDLEAVLHREHSYSVPEFLVVNVAGGSAQYLSWLFASVQSKPEDSVRNL